MKHAEMKILPPKSRAVYEALLRSKKPLTANEISKRLGIVPNAVYRPAEELVSFGMIRQTPDYPARYQALEPDKALSWYLLAMGQQFRRQFGVKDTPKRSSAPSLTFIKDRQSLLERTDRDAARAKKTIDYIVSGLEVPDETVLVYRQAVARGVRVRKMIQRSEEATDTKLEEWRKNGIEVRLCLDLGTRMFIFDDKIVYLTSYSTEQKDRAFGIRFEYPPLAVLLKTLFNEQWETRGAM